MGQKRADDSITDAQGRLRQAELVISNVLRWGVILSATIIALGVVWFYFDMGATGQAPVTYPHSLDGIVQQLGRGQPLALVALGLLLLLLTPIVRVAISILVFALERDWLYTVITIVVLLILLVSLALGRGGA
jgi:uncharacterized membrane protein